MFNDKLIVFTDGKYKRLRDVAISPLTHSLHYGSGVFDGIRAHKTIDGKTAVFRLYDYVDRFMKSTKKIGLDIEMSRDEVAEAIKKVIRKNNFSSAYIRLMAFFDHSSLGISTENNKTRFFVAAWQWDKYLPDGLNVGISDFRRISEKSTFVESKFSGHYINSLLASTRAKNDGFDDALILDGEEFVAEGSVANIFFIKGKKITTPKKGKIFPGLTRDSIMKIVKSMGFEVEEKNITEEEISKFDESFFTGTAAQVAPISKITLSDKSKIEFNSEESKKISDEFDRVVKGENKKFINWLEFI